MYVQSNSISVGEPAPTLQPELCYQAGALAPGESLLGHDCLVLMTAAPLVSPPSAFPIPATTESCKQLPLLNAELELAGPITGLWAPDSVQVIAVPIL
jgi:hypothetical protein